MFLLLALSIFLMPFSKSNTPQNCQDFLHAIQKKPAYLHFVGCQKTKVSQLDVLEAKYHVKGQDAAQAEQFLQDNFQMGQLKFICCGWELGMAGQGHLTTKHTTQVSMFSDQTILNQRQDWSQIPHFTVIVQHFLEEP